MRFHCALILVLVICLMPVLVGCEPAQPPREDLGGVVTGMPEVPDKDEPYKMPELGDTEEVAPEEEE